MSTHNNQNKRKVQEKYQKFKALQLQSQLESQLSPSQVISPSKILQSVDQNTSIKPFDSQTQQPTKNQDTFHNLLKSVPRTPKILQIMLSDPSIYEFSQSLKREAEQRNMQRLISSFPDRYRNLLEIQGKFNMIQKHSRDKMQKVGKEIQILMEKLWKSEVRCKQQDELIEQMRTKIRNSEQKSKDEYCQVFRKKQMQIMDLKQRLQTSEKKVSKLKQDYKNINTILIQLRQHEQTCQKQTARLVQKLTQSEQKLTKAHKKLLEYDNDKKLQQQSIEQQHKNQINQLNQRISYLQQLLQQANIRTQYKQSLLDLAEQDHLRSFGMLEDEIVKKGEELGQVRGQYLEALRAIDQLEERVNGLEEEKTREWGVWCTQREQLKKQLEKSHQWNGQLKAQLDVKNQLIKIQQKSLQYIKQSLQSQLHKKTAQQIQISTQFQQAQHQQQMLYNQIQNQQQKLQCLQNQINKLKTQNKQLVDAQRKIISQTQKQKDCNKAMNEETLRKYLDIVVEQEEELCRLRSRVERWVVGWEGCEGCEKDFGWNGEKNQGGLESQELIKSLERKNRQYEKVIEKMKNQILTLTNNSKQTNEKGAKILRQLIQQNKSLKMQLSHQPCRQIKLFPSPQN